MDIVIVLDGSNSIYPWYEVQDFLINILHKFYIGPGQTQVGSSTSHRRHVDTVLSSGTILFQGSVSCRLAWSSTVPRWSTSSASTSTRRRRRWWRRPRGSASAVARRREQRWVSMWRGTGQTLNRLSSPRHGSTLTHTSLACRSEAFRRGGRPGAQKVMIVITDGESHDSPQLLQAVADSERDNVTMYAIAVSRPLCAHR